MPKPTDIDPVHPEHPEQARDDATGRFKDTDPSDADDNDFTGTPPEVVDLAPEDTLDLDESAPEVRVATPFVRSYRSTTASGDTLVVTQTGVSVPEGDADSLIADAAKYGVTLERSK